MLERLVKMARLWRCTIVVKTCDGINRIDKELRQFGRCRRGIEGSVIVGMKNKMSLQNGTKGFSFSGNSEMGMQFTELQPDAFKVKKIFDLLIGGIVYSDLISEVFQV